MTTLLACPFCGGPNSEWDCRDHSAPNDYIVCADCGAQVGPSHNAPSDWNRRAPPVAIAHEAVDLLRSINKLIDTLHEDIEGYFGDELANVRAFLAKYDATPTASDRPVVRAEDTKDAERYRWLRDGANRTGDEDQWIIIGQSGGEDILWKSDLDRAIDTELADRAAPPSGDDRG